MVGGHIVSGGPSITKPRGGILGRHLSGADLTLGAA